MSPLRSEKEDHNNGGEKEDHKRGGEKEDHHKRVGEEEHHHKKGSEKENHKGWREKTTARPHIIGPDAGPEPPYPYMMEGKVISGFGRGSKELGIPTANLPVDSALTPWIESVPSGVYFGYASLALPATHPDSSPPSNTPTCRTSHAHPHRVFPMVMSIGYNPFYKNTVRSAEVHILHPFAEDFYGVHMKLLILGFVREEKDYESLEALVEDIKMDCEVARRSLRREGWGWERIGPAGGVKGWFGENGRCGEDGQHDAE